MMIVDLKCPNCLGTLTDYDYINSFYCKHCGARLEIDGQSKVVVKAKIRVKEMEHEERVIDKEYQFRTGERKELIEKEKENKRLEIRTMIIWFAVALILFFMGPAYSLLSQYYKDKRIETVEKEIVDDISNRKYDEALLKINRLRSSDDEEDIELEKKRDYYTQEINKMKKQGGMYYQTAGLPTEGSESNASESATINSNNSESIIPYFYDQIAVQKMDMYAIKSFAESNHLYIYESESDDIDGLYYYTISTVASKDEYTHYDFGEKYHIEISYDSRNEQLHAELVSPDGRHVGSYYSDR